MRPTCAETHVEVPYSSIDIDPAKLTDAYLNQSLLFPSKDIRNGYETAKILTKDETLYAGIIVENTSKQLMLRSASDLERPITIDFDSIEAKTIDRRSMMPDGLISAFRDQSQFFDLAAYVIEVARGGLSRARELRPSSEQLTPHERYQVVHYIREQFMKPTNSVYKPVDREYLER